MDLQGNQAPTSLLFQANPLADIPPTSSLETLPEAILLDIISRLPPEDVASRVTPLSRYFRTLSESPFVWQQFCRPEALTEHDASALGGWKDLFRRVYRTNLLCAPHFELLGTLQREQEMYDLTEFEPERLSSWSLWDHSELDSEEGSAGADESWLDPGWIWMPWEWAERSAIRELRPVGCPPCPGAPWAPCLATGCAARKVAQVSWRAWGGENAEKLSDMMKLRTG